MRKLCRRCNNYIPNAEGNSGICRLDGTPRECYHMPPLEVDCWRKKVRASGAERSALCAAAGRLGGRPKGSGKGRTPAMQVSILATDHKVLFAYAQKLGCSLRAAIHKICKSIINQYPDTKPEDWKD